MNKVIINILRFILLLTTQILICNHIHFFGFINPYIYVLSLLLLPLSIPKSWQYLIGFATGLLVDCFTMTDGVHASASLALIFVRPLIVNILNNNIKINEIEQVVPGKTDFKWLFLYTLILVLIHHIAVTFLEVFSFENFFYYLGTTLINVLFTTMTVLALEYIFIPVEK